MAVIIAVVQLQEDALRTEGTHTVAIAERSPLLRPCAVDGLWFRLEIKEWLGIS